MSRAEVFFARRKRCRDPSSVSSPRTTPSKGTRTPPSKQLLKGNSPKLPTPRSTTRPRRLLDFPATLKSVAVMPYSYKYITRTIMQHKLWIPLTNIWVKTISLVESCTIKTTVAGPTFFLPAPGASLYVGPKLAGLGEQLIPNSPPIFNLKTNLNSTDHFNSRSKWMGYNMVYVLYHISTSVQIIKSIVSNHEWMNNNLSTDFTHCVEVSCTVLL